MAKRLQTREAKLKRAKGTDAQTIFDTEMEAIRNFHIITPPWENTPGIPIVGNQNPPPIPPTRPGATAPPNNINERFDYFEYYSNILQRLGSDTFSNRELAKELADKQATLIQNTAPTKQTMETISKRPTKWPPGAFDGEIKSDFTSWKQAVETYFDYYRAEFSREDDKISWLEGILKDKALRWHQVRGRELQKLRVRDNWPAYWQAADAQFKKRHEITEKSRKLRKLRYTGDVLDYLVNLQDLNHTVASARQAFRDQVEAQLADDIINMMYMLGPIPEDDDAFLQVVELAGKRIEEMKRRAKARNFGEAKPQKNTTETEKVINKNKDNRKEKKKEETYKNNKKEEKDKKPKEKKYASTKEALKGISEELIQKHKSAGTSCWRCGRSNHYSTECFAKPAENGDSLEKPIISSQNKRKRNDDDEESKDTKKGKTAAVRAELEEQQQKRIWEMDTDSEEDF
jgi:hypothetical protein